MSEIVLITEVEVQRSINDGSYMIPVKGRVIVTPLAAESMKDHNVRLSENGASEQITTASCQICGEKNHSHDFHNNNTQHPSTSGNSIDVSGREKSFLLEIYKRLWRVRAFEEAAGILFREGRLVGFLHLSIGQEAVSVGACAALEANDYLTLAHRGHGQMVARGSSLNKMMAELLGKSTGYCGGKGGSVHLADFENGVLGANGIIGAGVSIATGAAMSAKMRGSNQIAVSFFGDGTVNHGTFHEAMNYASIHKLPAVFICENNQYAVSMSAEDAVASISIIERGKNYNMTSIQVDGQDVLAVHDAVLAAAKRARSGAGPTFLECMTWRHHGHWEGETIEVRPDSEKKKWEARDPIKMFEKSLIEANIADNQELRTIYDGIVSEIADAVRFAESSPMPDPDEVLKNVMVEI